MIDDQDNETNLAVILAIAAALVVAAFTVGIAAAVAISDQSAGTAAAASATDPAPAKLFFDLGADALPVDAGDQLAPVVAALRAAPQLNAYVSGFHDASGDAAANAELAKRRAMAVRDTLIAAGVDAGRVKLQKPQQTLGDSDPAHARRVEVVTRR